MKSITNFNFSNLLRIIFVLSVFVLLLISSISYKNNRNLYESSNLVKHTYEVNIQLENLISYIQDAETNQSGYIITKSDRFLKPYLLTHDKINSSFVTLKKLTADNLQQQKNLKKLFLLTKQRYEYFNQSIKYSSSERYDKKKLESYMFFGRILMENIRFHVDEMKFIEKKILIIRQSKLDDEISLTPLFTILVSLVSFLIIILSYKQIIQDIYNLKVKNKKLLISTKLMSESEIIGNFSTWYWDLGNQKITFSHNLSLLLGLQPNKFDLEKDISLLLGLQSNKFNLDKDIFLQFVHPDDKENVSQWLKSICQNKQLPFINYKVIRKDGSIRYFQSIGKLLHDKDGENLILGITFDVTEEHNQKMILSERNSELEKSNQELASFNRVASHDLQEPLRKIQTFISLISDSEKNNLSEKSREYLSKIETSAKRMRVLIDDLLLFTKTNTTKKEFVVTNLNKLLDDSLSDLSELIEEKKAKITAGKLPKISVIPYQIQQLFINLITNSLKYSQTGIAPEIIINCQKIPSSNYPEILDQSIKRYYQLTFTDNGIGFDPQFKTTIFVLFQRLHSTSAFSGTGIGLAICKKIVENHKGHIIADSLPNKGAVFTIFLPV